MKPTAVVEHDVEACEHAASEAVAWNRILGNYQGEQNGWKLAAAALRAESGIAFSESKDERAKQLRETAAWLDAHPRHDALRKEQDKAYAKQLEHEAIVEACPTGGDHCSHERCPK